MERGAWAAHWADVIADYVAARYGVSLHQGTDFDAYTAHVREARPAHPVGDPFDAKAHGLTPKTASWIIGRDAWGQIVHLQALRLLDTERLSVANYMAQRFLEFSPSELDLDRERSRYVPGPAAQRMRGRIVYDGETWVGTVHRGNGLSSYLGRYSMLVALRDYAPDHIIGFMARPVAYKGFFLRRGFMHAEPMALRWYARGAAQPLEGAMVYTSAEEVRFLADLPESLDEIWPREEAQPELPERRTA